MNGVNVCKCICKEYDQEIFVCKCSCKCDNCLCEVGGESRNYESGSEYMFQILYTIPLNKGIESRTIKCDIGSVCQCRCKRGENRKRCRCSCYCRHCCECYCTCSEDFIDRKCPYHSICGGKTQDTL